MEIRSNSFLQSRHRTRTLQTKRHLVKYISKVHRTRSGQEYAPSHRPAKIQSTSDLTTRRLPREVKPLHKTHCQIHNSMQDKCHTPATHRTKEIQHDQLHETIRTRLRKNAPGTNSTQLLSFMNPRKFRHADSKYETTK